MSTFNQKGIRMALILDLRERLSHAGVPLVNPTSEHVVLANVFGVLKNFSADAAINPHFLFELCVSGRMIEPTPVFMRLREQNEFYGGSTQWVRNKISPFSSRLIRL
jgi:hypothetical protein